MKNFENRVLQLQRPKSANPGVSTLESFLRTRARDLFNEEEARTLELLAANKNEILISSFEIYQLNQDEVELIDTFSRILKSKKNRSRSNFPIFIFFRQSFWNIFLKKFKLE